MQFNAVYNISIIVTNMFLQKTLVLVLLSALCNGVKSSRVLGVFSFAAPSHYILGNSLMKGLADAGHDVTMISPFEENNPPRNGSYRDIVLTGFREKYENFLKVMDLFETSNQSFIDTFLSFMKVIENINDELFLNENVKQLLKSDEKFDVVIVEQFFVDTVKIFGLIYNAPVIVFSPTGAAWANNIVGNPSPLSYIPELDLEFSSQMSFKERLINILTHLTSRLMDYWFYFPSQNAILRKHFPDAPDIYDLYYNVSLALLNSHESLNQAVPHVPNMIQIGGFHVRPPKKLPKDLQEYLDNATEGVIYFSMGSNLRSKNLPEFKRNAILTAFSKLKEKVLWKWEDDDLPGKPPNVKLAKWLPQQDILAHPNVKLFITHGGLLSTTETVYNGVPILAIPVFGDQPMNAFLATVNGYALALPYSDPSFSEEKLSEMLNELLTNPKYRENAKKRSQLFHDRPMKPMDTAVYWVEHIIRNKGAPHLRVEGANLPWYIYHSLDVVSFLTITSSLIMYLLFIASRKILRCWGICNGSAKKPKRD